MDAGDAQRAEERKWTLLAVAGDSAAFGRLVRRHEGAVRQSLRRYCGDAALADDVAQSAFLRAWRNLAELKDADAFAGWIRRIATNLCIDTLRARGRLAAAIDSARDLAEAEGLARPELRLDLEEALGRLGDAARLCVLLHHAEGFSHPEIAERTGIPVGTVKSHIARGTAQLRRLLGEPS